MILYLDTETYSAVPISHGTYAYAVSCEVMLVTYALDDSDPQCWDRTSDKGIPLNLYSALLNADKIVIHNSQFDRVVMEISEFKFTVPVSRIFDTMACAQSHALPASLANLCDALGVPADKMKDPRGKRLIQKFCTPHGTSRHTGERYPAEWQAFKEYAMSDIVAMRECYKRLPRWNYPNTEAKVFELDQTINDRGFQVDLELAQKAVEAVKRTQARLKTKTSAMTGGLLDTTTRRDALIEHIMGGFGLKYEDLQKSSVEKILANPETPLEVAELLRVRLQATTSSTAKYKALIEAVSADGRLRGTLQYCGASRTGRWAGRKFQPQNLARPKMSATEIEAAITAIKQGTEDLLFADPMSALSDCIRGCIVAPEGSKLVVADLSNIEGRVLAWLAGEEWKIEAFRQFDQGQGADIYKLAYAASFGVDPSSVTKDQRQIGKVQELALGYQGGVGAFATFASAYGIDLDAMAAKAAPHIPSDVMAEAFNMWDWAEKREKTYGMIKMTFVVCDALKRLWRRAHPQTSSMWTGLEDTCRAAIKSEGQVFIYEMFKIIRTGAWLRICLPSGREVCYPGVEINSENAITYMGVHQFSRKWTRLKTYGGKLVENLTQAVARDVLAHGMLQAEETGFDVVLSVHDELITEAAPTLGIDDLVRCMTSTPPWATGLPLAAAGYEGLRYRKD